MNVLWLFNLINVLGNFLSNVYKILAFVKFIDRIFRNLEENC